MMLSKTAQRTLTGWEAHGPRLLKATSYQIYKRKINMDVTQCYGPTNDSNEDAKEEFCCRLSTIIRQSPRPNVSSWWRRQYKTVSDNRGYEEILEQMNNKGERFADLCALSNLAIGRRVFQHKRIRKATWVSPDLSAEHVCIGRKFRSLQHVCVKRGADVASDPISLLPS